MKICLHTTRMCGVPVIELCKDAAHGKRPMLILIHGLSDSKEKMLRYGYEFAKEGYFVCLIDAHMHGELKPERIKGLNDYYRLRTKEFFSIHIRTAQKINPFIAAYNEHAIADAARVGLLGISLGGLVVYKYLAAFYRSNVKVAIPIVGSPAWASMLVDHMKRTGLALADEKGLAYLRTIEPLAAIGSIRDVALLMLNGEKDDIVPIRDIRKCHQMIKRNYRNKKKLRFKEYKGLAHQVTDDMIRESKTWIKTNMRRT